MFARALFAFLALPGVVAFLVPIFWLARTHHLEIVYPPGVLLWIAGVVVLLWCVRDFYVSGKGTLAPWSPPRHLVVVGLYRFSRNPMYVGVLMILLGWAWTFGSRDLLIYALCVAVAVHVRVVLGEEPWLAQAHGEEWIRYRSRVRRWF
jgi:protein-S-isoprenylcysteine O-methyltransferase Ste14